MDTYDSLVTQLEELCEKEDGFAPSTIAARLTTLVERMELTRRGSASFVHIERIDVFPLLSLPDHLVPYVLSQLDSYGMAVAAKICTTTWRAASDEVV